MFGFQTEAVQGESARMVECWCQWMPEEVAVEEKKLNALLLGNRLEGNVESGEIDGVQAK